MPRHRNHGLRKRCGCSRTQWPKCSHGWHFNFSWKGVSKRLSLDRECGRHIDSKTEAEQEADRLRHAIREGTFGMTPAAVTTTAALTFDAFAALFVERARRARRDASHRANRRSMLRQLGARACSLTMLIMLLHMISSSIPSSFAIILRPGCYQAAI